MRRYLMNPSILTSVAGVVPLIKDTASSRSKLRTVAAWAAWLGSIAAAVAAVREATEREREHEAELRRESRRS